MENVVPALTDMKVFPLMASFSVIRTGVFLLIVVSSPSSPLLLSPQA